MTQPTWNPDDVSDDLMGSLNYYLRNIIAYGFSNSALAYLKEFYDLAQSDALAKAAVVAIADEAEAITKKAKGSK